MRKVRYTCRKCGHIERHRAKRRPEAASRIYARRKAWLKSGDVTSEQLRALFMASNGQCVHCGDPIKNPVFWRTGLRGFDHVIPRSKGGQHTISNIVVCCGYCNTQKRDKIP